MRRSLLCLVLSLVVLTLSPSFASAFTCGTPGGWGFDCTCAPGFVKECKWRPRPSSRCLCREPGADWGINPGGKAELHKKNVPTVTPGGGGPASAYWQTSRRPRAYAAPRYQMQRQRWEVH
jgi:hypothetical protein